MCFGHLFISIWHFRSRISTSGCIKITLITVAFSVANFVQYVYQYELTDPRDYFNINETLPAYCEIGLRVFGKLIF